MGIFPYKLLNQWIPAFPQGILSGHAIHLIAGMTALEGGLSNDICESPHTFSGINLAQE